MVEFENKQSYDVLVIGAGGAGLRAAIEARLSGKKVAIITKSLFGKAHTVMAEGGCAAAMGNVNENDNWMVHFRDTMRGGKFLNNWRMAELHAKEAPDRVWELETYGALFDRTPEGKISQRNFGGHTFPRLAHVGDRTGLELIRTLQQKVVSLQQEDFAETGDYESKIKVFVNDIQIVAEGKAIAYNVQSVVAALSEPEVRLRVSLAMGDGRGVAWGCDLTEEYVVFNSAYTT